MIKPDVSTESIPYSNVKDGLNYIDNSVFFILNAPGKQFVNLVGSFNDWEISDEYLMRYDEDQDRF